MRTMPSAASEKMPPRLKPMMVYAANAAMRLPQEQIQPEVVCQPPPTAEVYVKQWLGSCGPEPYDSGTDHPVWNPCKELSAWTSESAERFLPALRAASTKTIAAVHECCV